MLSLPVPGLPAGLPACGWCLILPGLCGAFLGRFLGRFLGVEVWALRWLRPQRLQQQIIKIVLPDVLPGNVEKGPDSPFIFLVLQQIRKLAIGFFGRVAGI